MRLIAILLIVGGIIALLVPSITFFTTDRVADVGFIQIDMQKPHTIVLNPVVGAVALAAGVILLLGGSKATDV